MILVVSDLHLGKVSSSDEQSLSEFRNCIGSLKTEISKIVFLGDTFDAFIEYPGHIPEPVTLWTKMALELQNDGLEIVYFSGNHDRWHLEHIPRALNIPVLRSPRQISRGKHRIWMEHGDCVANHSPVVRFLRYVSDRAWAYRLYRTFLPFGAGHWLSAAVSRRFSNYSPEPSTVAALKSHARKLILENKSDLVIMGHCHTSSLQRFDRLDSKPNQSNTPGHGESNSNDTGSGIYANTGDWYEARTFVTISDRVRLLRWSENRVELIAEEIL
ncbi:MAG: metallophosphoesterase [Bacteroidetes bacterium]|nr:metallophosphoesterase [Bacteroidota bacterium]